MEISLVPITESPEDATRALAWALDQWGDHLPNYTHQNWIDFYAQSAQSNYNSWEGNGQELVYLARRGDQLLATIGLVDFDELEEFRHLTPWIAAFIVNPELRGQGIGSQVLRLLEERARTLGIEVLHLWTEDQRAFYQKRGYQLVASSKLESLDLVVMQKRLINL